MLRQHLHSWNAHSLVKGECFTQRIGRRPIHRRMVLVPINAVKDRVEEDRLTNGKKGAPDMNAAVTSAIEAQKSEKASKRQKRRYDFLRAVCKEIFREGYLCFCSNSAPDKQW